MIILSHRGFWRFPGEKNAHEAFVRTVDYRFGTETDVRDHLGDLVVSHDPPGAAAMPWRDVVDLFSGTGLPLAVNIKADGLSGAVKDAFAGADIDWFAFDMSGPETVRYAAAGLPFFTRHSDVEPFPILYEQAAGVWLDSFGPCWFGPEDIRSHLRRGKRVCVVSPELHGRPHHEQWEMLRSLGDDATPLMLCTDIPDQGRAYFA